MLHLTNRFQVGTEQRSNGIGQTVRNSQTQTSATPASPLIGPMQESARSMFLASNTRVALINPEVLPFKSTNLDTRLRSMMNSVYNADKLFTKLEKKSGVVKDKLFVAPEYAFDKAVELKASTVQSNDRQLTQAEKCDLVQHMKQLSAAYPDMTIMPGSISWMKEANRTENLEAYLSRHGIHIEDVNHPQYELYRQKYFKKQHACVTEPNNDNESNSNTRINKANRRINDAIQKYNLSLPRADSDTTHIVHNASYVFRGGAMIAKHHKFGDFNEITQEADGEKRLFSPGDEAGQFFLPNGTRVSIELCIDHGYGITGHHNNSVQPGGIHVLQSDYVLESSNPEASRKEIAGNTHVFVHASTIRKKNTQPVHGVKTIDTKTAEKSPVKPIESNTHVSVYEPGNKPKETGVRNLLKSLFSKK